jgi:hypothetical protein
LRTAQADDSLHILPIHLTRLEVAAVIHSSISAGLALR